MPARPLSDETLQLIAAVREAFTHRDDVEERPLFGWSCFFVDNKLCVGVKGDELLVRLAPTDHQRVAEKPGVRELDSRGGMQGYFCVEPSAYATRSQWEEWIGAALAYNPSAKASPRKKPAAASLRVIYKSERHRKEHPMSLRIVQLGTLRSEGEGLRIGTVRRPPRGVPKTEFASRDYYDVWYPELSPEAELMHSAQEAVKLFGEGQDEEAIKRWKQFDKQFRKQLAEAASSRTLDLLAALSHTAAFSIGCYCEDERHCHRSILRSLLKERGALLSDH